MMGIIWAALFTAGIIYMLFTGRGDSVLGLVTDGASRAVSLSISLAGIYCFWLGIMNIAKKSGLTDKIASLTAPLLRKLFPNTGEAAFDRITMNISANMLGLSNAATPFGLQAMKALKEESPFSDKASDDMIMFLILNTASLEIIPSTVISLRESMGAANPEAVILPSLIATAFPCMIGIIICRVMRKNNGRN